MIRRLQHASALLILLAFGCVNAQAHKPVVINGGPTNFETAHAVPDPEVSYVGYHERTPEAPELWFTFEAEEGTSLYMQPGVPKIDRYEMLRPAMVLLGPGMPEVDVPFTIPAGYGGKVVTSENQDPFVFEEEFTGTTSWQFPPTRLDAPETGRYYLVGYIPSGENGKFWIALGEEEVFGIGDIVSLPKTLIQVRLFHEVFPVGGILGWALLLILLAVSGLVASFF